ncbi:MAG TPA: aldo/keto reductase [Chitinophagaceae bacterium]|nr:aldo/keto reductase [Chitinophagaceae bacterium]
MASMIIDVSRLTLGTVQLGLNYGIANKAGQPDQSKSYAILNAALKAGINTLDTAYDYGNAEAVIGGFLKARAERPLLNIVSKFRIEQEHMGKTDLIRKDVYDKVRKSISDLGIEKIPIYLFHQSKDQPLEIMEESISLILEELKSEGLIEKGGISVDRPGNMDLIINNTSFECVQVPINIFDQKLIRDHSLIKLKEKGKIVFARSIFLQGLFFMEPGLLTGNLKQAESYLITLKRLAEDAGLSKAELAFSFVRDLEGISSLIFGAEREDQVQQNIQFMDIPSLSEEIRLKAAELFADISEEIITPRLWQP